MSELMNTSVEADSRWLLLTTVSTFALLTVYAAQAEEARQPTVWIELGGQLERTDSGAQPFSPYFVDVIEAAGFASPNAIQRPPRFSTGGEGRVVFAPEDSNWTFTAALRYGRSNGGKHIHQQTYAVRSKYFPAGLGLNTGWHPKNPPGYHDFADTQTKQKSSHLIADFQIGRDVGIGLFGREGASNIAGGIRFAQFDVRSSAAIAANPHVDVYNTAADLQVPGIYVYIPGYRFHNYYAAESSKRSFQGVGPSIMWRGSVPIVRTEGDRGFTFDWGIAGALLFGRQKAEIKHHTVDTYKQIAIGIYPNYLKSIVANSGGDIRARSVVVPNLGGFAGMSLKFPNAKISLGYRADFFFGAVDAGIDTRHTQDMSFHGPFATISIGLGG